MVAIGVHGHGPMHEIEVYIIKAEVLEADVEVFLCPAVERAPKLGGDEEVLAFDQSLLKRLFQRLANLAFVAVYVCAVNMLVAVLDRMQHRSLDLARF